MGWTQHTTGVQMIRASTILQLLLGNIGRPGGGIMALRGHASIQGSTDIPTLYNLLPGYLNCPSALKSHETMAAYLKTEISPTSYWVNMPQFFVSLDERPGTGRPRPRRTGGSTTRCRRSSATIRTSR